jgi:hypothetical protein
MFTPFALTRAGSWWRTDTTGMGSAPSSSTTATSSSSSSSRGKLERPETRCALGRRSSGAAALHNQGASVLCGDDVPLSLEELERPLDHRTRFVGPAG